MMAIIIEPHKRFVRQNGTRQQFKNKTGIFITFTVFAFDFGNNLFETAHRCSSVVVRPLSDDYNITVFNFTVNVKIAARRENAETLITTICALYSLVYPVEHFCNFLQNQPEP